MKVTFLILLIRCFKTSFCLASPLNLHAFCITESVNRLIATKRQWYYLYSLQLFKNFNSASVSIFSLCDRSGQLCRSVLMCWWKTHRCVCFSICLYSPPFCVKRKKKKESELTDCLDTVIIQISFTEILTLDGIRMDQLNTVLDVGILVGMCRK